MKSHLQQCREMCLNKVGAGVRKRIRLEAIDATSAFSRRWLRALGRHLRAVVVPLFLLIGSMDFAICATVQVAELRCEYLDDPLGLDVSQPRLSWKLMATDPEERGQSQTAWHVLVATTEPLLQQDKGDLWDSGETKSDQSVLVHYGGRRLSSGQRCWWKVRVRDEHGAWTEWSAPAYWSMGLLQRGDWRAQWIGTDQKFVRKQGSTPPDDEMADPWFRKTFELPDRPVRAQIYVASVGYHELYVNGQRVGDAVLAPCTTDHKHRARYVTYEIGGLLRPGGNVIGLWLGTSWSIFPPYRTEEKPQSPIAIAQADIELAGGQTVRVVTDASWKTHPSPNTLLGRWDFMHFGGELYDARREMPGWNELDHDASGWDTATVFEPKLVLSAEKVEPNRTVKLIRPVAITEAAPGVFRVDMGMNFSGWTEIAVRGQPGQRVEFQFSERENEAMTHRLHSAYVIGPRGEGRFKNRFNYSSGRWITIKGLRYKPSLGDVRGWLVRTDYERAAQFECDVPLLNRIYETALWTFENLSLGGYVVDCPQRERMGYGGDAHATTPAGLNNYRLGAFYTKWIEDWRDVQGNSAAWGTGSKALPESGKQIEDGNLPYTAPTYWGGGGPAWSGFCVTLPWLVYRQYGDRRILEENFPMIQRWLDFLETKSDDDMLKRWGGQWDFLGDWLWPGAKGVNGDTTETLFFNNCYWIYNLQTAARIAEVLGKTEIAGRYRQRAEAVRAAVHAKFFNAEDNSYVNGFQAYLAMALYVDLPPRERRDAVWKRLEREILEVRDGHIWAGITGGAFLFNTLLAHDRNDLIYAMASQKDYPSWGHMLERGATTLWEDWEGDPRHSRLHSSYLYIAAWPMAGLAGIQPMDDRPGFKRFLLKPGLVGTGVQRVKASYDSLYGPIKVSWERDSGKLVGNLVVPPNTTALVHLPTSDPGQIRESGQTLNAADGISIAETGDQRCVLSLAPGQYRFQVPMPK